MPQQTHRFKSKHKISVHTVGTAIPIERNDGGGQGGAGEVGGEIAANAHVVVWRLFESPTGELEATEMYAGAFNPGAGFPASFTPNRPGHYTVFMVNFQNDVLHIYSQGPHGVRPA